jgi:hypothetical protein
MLLTAFQLNGGEGRLDPAGRPTRLPRNVPLIFYYIAILRPTLSLSCLHHFVMFLRLRVGTCYHFVCLHSVPLLCGLPFVVSGFRVPLNLATLGLVVIELLFSLALLLGAVFWCAP